MNFLRGEKYPVDKTGQSPNNRVASETHKVSPTYNVIVPVHAPFFAESMIVRFGDRTLTKEVDYQFDDLDAEASEASNKSVYNTIVLKRNDIQGDVILDYQTYGTSNFVGVIAKYIDLLLKDNRGIDFKNLFNVPERFNPIYHMHHVKDIIGIWPIVIELQKIVKAIENLRYKGNLKLRGEILDHIAALNQKFDNYRTMVADALDLTELKATIRDNIGTIITDEIRKTLNGVENGYWKVPATRPATSTVGQTERITIHQLNYADFFKLTEAQVQRVCVTGHLLGIVQNTTTPVYGFFFLDKVLVLPISAAFQTSTIRAKLKFSRLNDKYYLHIDEYDDGLLKNGFGTQIIQIKPTSFHASTPYVADTNSNVYEESKYAEARRKANSVY